MLKLKRLSTIHTEANGAVIGSLHTLENVFPAQKYSVNFKASLEMQKSRAGTCFVLIRLYRNTWVDFDLYCNSVLIIVIFFSFLKNNYI